MGLEGSARQRDVLTVHHAWNRHTPIQRRGRSNAFTAVVANGIKTSATRRLDRPISNAPWAPKPHFTAVFAVGS